MEKLTRIMWRLLIFICTRLTIRYLGVKLCTGCHENDFNQSSAFQNPHHISDVKVSEVCILMRNGKYGVRL